MVFQEVGEVLWLHSHLLHEISANLPMDLCHLLKHHCMVRVEVVLDLDIEPLFELLLCLWTQ